MAQFGKLLEEMSRAQALSDSPPSLSIASRIGLEAGRDGLSQLDGGKALASFRSTAPPATTHDAAAPLYTDQQVEGAAAKDAFEGLIQALDRHDEETARAKAKMEAERQVEMMNQDAIAYEVGSTSAGGMDWMGFCAGSEGLSGDEDFSALLDLNAFASEPSAGNMFNNPAAHGDFHAAAASFSSEDAPAPPNSTFTSPLFESSVASAISTLLSSFDNSESIFPGSTATQLFSEFSSPEDVNLGHMFPPLATQSSRCLPDGSSALAPPAQSTMDSMVTAGAAFEDVHLDSLADRGVFSLPLMGGFQATTQHTSPQLNMQSSSTFGVASPAGSPKDLFGPPSTPVLTSQASFEQPIAAPKVESRLPSASPALSHARPFLGGRSDSTSSSTAPALKKRKPYEPTGTRNSRPLLDASAPTMTKKYAAPGKTTRKVIPVGFQKKLKLQSNETGDADLPQDADGETVNELMNEIEEKRRKNCVAARESRRRKFDFQNGLKDEIKGWREWADQVEAVLRSAGREDLFATLPEQPEAMGMEE